VSITVLDLPVARFSRFRPLGTPGRPAASGFPVTLTDAYALQFGQVYLNYSAKDAGQRASQLGAFLPSGSDPQLGWNGQGTSLLQSEQVATTDVQDAGPGEWPTDAAGGAGLRVFGRARRVQRARLAPRARASRLADTRERWFSLRHPGRGDEPAPVVLPGLRRWQSSVRDISAATESPGPP
jgi:hypothetical protein